MSAVSVPIKYSQTVICALNFVILQAFVSNLTREQCCELIIAAYSNKGGIQLAKSLVSSQAPLQEPPSNQLNWCICRKCHPMKLAMENVCCRQRPCITSTEYFDSVVMDNYELSVAIVNRSEVFADEPDYSPASYCKAAYRQWVLWQHGYLGGSDHRVIPSCVVWQVRNKYLVVDGIYLGFKEY